MSTRRLVIREASSRPQLWFTGEQQAEGELETAEDVLDLTPPPTRPGSRKPTPNRDPELADKVASRR